jgi:hypothetical protein
MDANELYPKKKKSMQVTFN